MKRKYNNMFPFLFSPLIVALVTTLIIQFIEEKPESELIGFTMFENLMVSALIFLGLYLFTIIVAAPIDLYLMNRVKNKILYFILFNSIGLVLIACLNVWILKSDDLKSLFSIFPLFAILSLSVEVYFKK
ncbi:pilus assembly protein PilB [Lysinibacillus xylanilyticus]|uniref:pilus assembly protein PilB n=1 Tax=Lysinibacillus xylanilyticus TaxID=582475 RepID=UPI0038097393